jgi:hypothetical protein
MKIYPNKKPANYSFEREKPRYLCATFHNEIHPRENNLILIPSGQTNKIMFKFEEKINQYNSLCFHGIIPINYITSWRDFHEEIV